MGQMPHAGLDLHGPYAHICETALHGDPESAIRAFRDSAANLQEAASPGPGLRVNTKEAESFEEAVFG